jgi:hypothetical protein
MRKEISTRQTQLFAQFCSYAVLGAAHLPPSLPAIRTFSVSRQSKYKSRDSQHFARSVRDAASGCFCVEEKGHHIV